MSPSSAGYPTGNPPSVMEYDFLSFHSRSFSPVLQPWLFGRTQKKRTISYLIEREPGSLPVSPQPVSLVAQPVGTVSLLVKPAGFDGCHC